MLETSFTYIFRTHPLQKKRRKHEMKAKQVKPCDYAHNMITKIHQNYSLNIQVYHPTLEAKQCTST